MVREIDYDSSERNGHTYTKITLEFDPENENDTAIMEKLYWLCEAQQKCTNCIHFYEEGCFGGYMACACKIHGILEVLGNPHYDMDGSKCTEYMRKEQKGFSK